MRIRFVGLLSEAQVAKALAGYKTIKPAEGIFIKGGLSYTFTFKKGVAVAVTVRRAPQITILDEPDLETSVEAAVEPSATPPAKLPLKATGTASCKFEIGFKNKIERDHLLEMADNEGYKWNSGHNPKDFKIGDNGTLSFNRNTKTITYGDNLYGATISYDEVFK